MLKFQEKIIFPKKTVGFWLNKYSNFENMEFKKIEI